MNIINNFCRKSGNLSEIDKLLKYHNILKIIQEENNCNSPISVKKIKFVVKNFLQGKLQIVSWGKSKEYIRNTVESYVSFPYLFIYS